MYRVEVISNKSVEEDITEALEQYVPGICYTKLPLVYGRGDTDYKLGTTTWPETNFVLVAYVHDEQLDNVRSVVAGVKAKFKKEGAKVFVVKAEEI